MVPAYTRRMRKTVFVFLILMLVAAAAFLGAQQLLPTTSIGGTGAHTGETSTPAVVEATVLKHTDGDTARFLLAGGAEERVRFIGIDTPEVGENAEPLGDAAASFTASEIPVGSTVWLETDADLRDRHGRLLAYVWLEPPASADPAEVAAHMLNARLLSQGYALTLTVPPNVKHVEVFGTLAETARRSGVGLWGR